MDLIQVVQRWIILPAASQIWVIQLRLTLQPIMSPGRLLLLLYSCWLLTSCRLSISALPCGQIVTIVEVLGVTGRCLTSSGDWLLILPILLLRGRLIDLVHTAISIIWIYSAFIILIWIVLLHLLIMRMLGWLCAKCRLLLLWLLGLLQYLLMIEIDYIIYHILINCALRGVPSWIDLRIDYLLIKQLLLLHLIHILNILAVKLIL